MSFSFKLIHFACTLLNPFEIPFEDKKELSYEDLQNIQDLLRSVDIKPKLQELFPVEYPWFSRLKPLKEIEKRTTRCLKQTLIDTRKEIFPESGLIEINEGGEDCFVLSCPLNGPYKILLKDLVASLEELGFNGHIYYKIGGVANPTGQEAKWAGVPYAFKIFTMMEAKDLGFKRVIWLDSALFALENPQKLFDVLKNEGSLVLHRSHPTGYILPATKELIYQKTGVNLEIARHVRMWVFGLDMEQPWVDSFLKEYKEMVELGLPFISCYPEEFVISALLHKHDDKIPSLKKNERSSARGYDRIVQAQNRDPTQYRDPILKNVYFVIRDH